MSKKKTYIFHTDPGHGWIAVKMAELLALGIDQDITGYSYVAESGLTVYLEEDIDANTFFKKMGVCGMPISRGQITDAHIDESHRIRLLPHYDKTQIRLPLKVQLKAAFNLDDTQFSTYARDLYVLFDERIVDWLHERGQHFTIQYSNVEGQTWHGKRFIEIPSVIWEDVELKSRAKNE